jgi:hypothetical protein
MHNTTKFGNFHFTIIINQSPTERRLVARLGEIKISTKEKEMSPVAVIGKRLPLVVWISRFSEYLLKIEYYLSYD